MSEMKYLHEPKLTFGYGQQSIDPRDGLLLYGPFDNKKVLGKQTVGIIGPKELRAQFISYMKKIHAPVVNDDPARPNFPGLESAFGVSINFDNIQEIDIPNEKLDVYKHYVDPYQRIHNWTELYFQKLKRYIEEEECAVAMWFVVIPDYIYQFGRPKSRIPKDALNVKIGLPKKTEILYK